MSSLEYQHTVFLSLFTCIIITNNLMTGPLGNSEFCFLCTVSQDQVEGNI